MKKMGYGKSLVIVPILLFALAFMGCPGGSDDNGYGLSVSITGNLTVAIGGTTQLTATVSPAGTAQGVTWSSSAEAVATVSSTGLVTGVSGGQAVIRATSIVDPSVSATRTVTVTGGAGADLIFAVTLPGARAGDGTNATLPPAAGQPSTVGFQQLPGQIAVGNPQAAAGTTTQAMIDNIPAGIIDTTAPYRERVFRITEAEFYRIYNIETGAAATPLGLSAISISYPCIELK